MIDLSLLSEGRLIVVGNVNRDIKTAPIEPTPNLFADGETSTAFVRETVGGGGANSAFAAASLRAAQVSFVGKVGNDALGDRLARTFASRRVQAHLIRDTHNPTGNSINLVWANGHRHFVSSLPASASLAVEEIDLGSFAAHDHLLRADPWFAQPMLMDGGNRRLFEAAKNAGLAVSLDINWDPQWSQSDAELIDRRKRALREALPLVDLAHGNVKELCAFAETNELTSALALLAQWGVGAVVVHMGREGAGYFDGANLIIEPAVPASRTINTTGTGDVLSVCMMLMHANAGLDVRGKLRQANRIVAQYIEGHMDLVPPISD